MGPLANLHNAVTGLLYHLVAEVERVPQFASRKLLFGLMQTVELDLAGAARTPVGQVVVHYLLAAAVEGPLLL